MRMSKDFSMELVFGVLWIIKFLYNDIKYQYKIEFDSLSIGIRIRRCFFNHFIPMKGLMGEANFLLDREFRYSVKIILHIAIELH